jgi:hypothetical protein
MAEKLANSDPWDRHRHAPRAPGPKLALVRGQERGTRRRKGTIMGLSLPHVDGFERTLLRRGVGALEANRDRCADCGRTPLTGEQVHLYEGRKRGIVCELCRQLRSEAPVATELVRHCEHGHTVRLTVRAA